MELNVLKTELWALGIIGFIISQFDDLESITQVGFQEPDSNDQVKWFMDLLSGKPKRIVLWKKDKTHNGYNLSITEEEDYFRCTLVMA